MKTRRHEGSHEEDKEQLAIEDTENTEAQSMSSDSASSVSSVAPRYSLRGCLRVLRVFVAPPFNGQVTNGAVRSRMPHTAPG